MSRSTLERAIVAGAREVLKNPALKLADVQEWSTGPLTPQSGEIVVHVPDPGVYIAVKQASDKRG